MEREWRGWSEERDERKGGNRGEITHAPAS
jgi:hypothetical protein